MPGVAHGGSATERVRLRETTVGVPVALPLPPVTIRRNDLELPSATHLCAEALPRAPANPPTLLRRYNADAQTGRFGSDDRRARDVRFESQRAVIEQAAAFAADLAGRRGAVIIATPNPAEILVALFASILAGASPRYFPFARHSTSRVQSGVLSKMRSPA